MISTLNLTLKREVVLRDADGRRDARPQLDGGVHLEESDVVGEVVFDVTLA